MNPVSKAQQPPTKKTGFRGPSPDVGKATQFKPGNPGGGRSKKKILTEIYEEILAHPANRKAVKSAIIGIIKQRRMATILTLREMAERTEGKVPDELLIDDLRTLPDEELAKRLQALENHTDATDPGSDNRKDRTSGRVGTPEEGT